MFYCLLMHKMSLNFKHQFCESKCWNGSMKLSHFWNSKQIWVWFFIIMTMTNEISKVNVNQFIFPTIIINKAEFFITGTPKILTNITSKIMIMTVNIQVIFCSLDCWPIHYSICRKFNEILNIIRLSSLLLPDFFLFE